MPCAWYGLDEAQMPWKSLAHHVLSCSQALDQLSTKDGGQPVMHQQAADVFQKLAADLDTEGRYLFLNALANQLRFPNNHTHYFSCILLYLFDQNAKVLLLTLPLSSYSE